jgi:hypothetical protein
LLFQNLLSEQELNWTQVLQAFSELATELQERYAQLYQQQQQQHLLGGSESEDRIDLSIQTREPDLLFSLSKQRGSQRRILSSTQSHQVTANRSIRSTEQRHSRQSRSPSPPQLQIQPTPTRQWSVPEKEIEKENENEQIQRQYQRLLSRSLSQTMKLREKVSNTVQNVDKYESLPPPPPPPLPPPPLTAHPVPCQKLSPSRSYRQSMSLSALLPKQQEEPADLQLIRVPEQLTSMSYSQVSRSIELENASKNGSADFKRDLDWEQEQIRIHEREQLLLGEREGFLEKPPRRMENQQSELSFSKDDVEAFVNHTRSTSLKLEDCVDDVAETLSEQWRDCETRLQCIAQTLSDTLPDELPLDMVRLDILCFSSMSVQYP